MPDQLTTSAYTQKVSKHAEWRGRGRDLNDKKLNKHKTQRLTKENKQVEFNFGKKASLYQTTENTEMMADALRKQQHILAKYKKYRSPPSSSLWLKTETD